VWDEHQILPGEEINSGYKDGRAGWVLINMEISFARDASGNTLQRRVHSTKIISLGELIKDKNCFIEFCLKTACATSL
jgi:hypothetical protein